MSGRKRTDRQRRRATSATCARRSAGPPTVADIAAAAVRGAGELLSL
jgi:hypothetical protein